MANFLEQLAREWYEYQGYFVRQNINVGKLKAGGYECELDIVAFNPKTQHLVHVEPSMDADSWATRERRYEKKFAAGRKYIPELFAGLDLPEDIEQIALFVFASTKNRQHLADGRILILDQFLAEILAGLADSSIFGSAVPEQLPLVRTLQFVSHYRKIFLDAWAENITEPKRFHVSIGGYMGSSYSVQLVRGELQYKSCEQGYANWKTETIPVTDEQWGTFRAAIDSLDVWRWEREYVNPGVCDGTQWDVDIAYTDKRIRSHGNNNYPIGDATGSGGPEETEIFDRFISAVQFLVGGRNFQ